MNPVKLTSEQLQEMKANVESVLSDSKPMQTKVMKAVLEVAMETGKFPVSEEAVLTKLMELERVETKSKLVEMICRD